MNDGISEPKEPARQESVKNVVPAPKALATAESDVPEERKAVDVPNASVRMPMISASVETEIKSLNNTAANEESNVLASEKHSETGPAEDIKTVDETQVPADLQPIIESSLPLETDAASHPIVSEVLKKEEENVSEEGFVPNLAFDPSRIVHEPDEHDFGFSEKFSVISDEQEEVPAHTTTTVEEPVQNHKEVEKEGGGLAVPEFILPTIDPVKEHLPKNSIQPVHPENPEPEPYSEPIDIYKLLSEMSAFDFGNKEKAPAVISNDTDPTETETDSDTKEAESKGEKSDIAENQTIPKEAETDTRLIFADATETQHEVDSSPAPIESDHVESLNSYGDIPIIDRSIDAENKTIAEKGFEKTGSMYQETIKPEVPLARPIVEDNSYSSAVLYGENSPITDLRKAININDRYRFINELFKGDEVLYEKCIRTIQGFSIYPEASFWINKELKPKLGWKEESEAVIHFESLVKRRFS